ncbi:transcriptional regulator WhiB-like [Mycobacterium phage Aziz]|uniref:WhiB family transcription factor n=1 Tax=Mycobacterium phage Aziz TaxID=2762281 RepID=A0A7G8LHL7_9CAUD|nr:transcriptional regulator WhiB-like [Mycobacterium phage Aziz]ASR75926.1 WhiB family transcription factor [Mycobacterium phage GenevaB15]QNJ56739.1 WhiB family transcription factor [Mycobacterium phage Aziz]
MTATLEDSSNGFDWRTRSVCTAEDFDMSFDSVEDLIENGMAKEEAHIFCATTVEQAKAVCARCPVISQCRDDAFSRDEEYGVWGGMAPQERKQERKVWLQLRVGPAVPEVVGEVTDPDALSSNPAANAKLTRRNERARIARDLILLQPHDWKTCTPKQNGTRTREQHLQVMDMILASPSATAEQIANRIGKRGEYVNSMLREACAALDIA